MMTKTRTFGSSSRVGHDSTSFYARRMYDIAQAPPGSINQTDVRNRIICKSSEEMTELVDNCVSLVVTSPPYNVGKDYDDDLTMGDYLGLLERVFKECYRVLQPGGRACINVANVGRKPYIPLSHLVGDIMRGIGLLMRGEVIWRKAAGASGSCAWGSFCAATNPTLRDVHEYILIFSKDRFDRPARGESTISKDAFMRDTLSIWEFPPESASKVGHPAPFPVELPSRLIHLYSFLGDLVLDPFAGSGTTCLAAKFTGRDYVGYELNENYARLAYNRLNTLL
ncbi:MAG: site-specific DNA-methyltransferase [Dehalococcoidia bacterium]|nr:site-specific DNA-methyltransferase [Dehalococcoidia bacterium]